VKILGDTARRIVAVCVLASLLVVLVGGTSPVTAADPPDIGDRAPIFSAPDFSGREVDLSTIIGHKAVLLMILGSPYDRSLGTLRDLQDLYSLYAGKPVEFVVVFVGLNRPSAEAVLNEVRPTYVTIMDDGACGLSYPGAAGKWYVIGLDGIIDRAEAWWDPLRGLYQAYRSLNAAIGEESVELAEGSALPELTFQDDNGQPVKVAGGAAGLVLFFWDSGGQQDYQRLDLMALDALDEQYRTLGLEFVAVGSRFSEQAKAWVDRVGLSFPVLWDPGCHLKLFGGGSQPTQLQGSQPTLLICTDAQGLVREIEPLQYGRAGRTMTEIRRVLDSVLGEAAPDAGNLPPGLPAVGSRVPDFALPDSEGRTFSSSSLAGRPVCYILWSSGCSCATSLIVRLQELYPQYRARGMEFVLIDADYAALPYERDWLRGNPVPFPVVFDPFSRIADAWGAPPPSLVVADRNGIVTFSGTGLAYKEDAAKFVGERRVIFDLVDVLEEVADPPASGKPGPTDPLWNPEPMIQGPDNFGGIHVFFDPLLGEARISALTQGLKESLPDLCADLGLPETMFSEAQARLSFYADPLRYTREESSDGMSVGQCFFAGPSAVRMGVCWAIDLETTLVVMRHELTHALLRLTAKSDIPPWFNEGLAQSVTSPRMPDFTVAMQLRGDPERPGPDEVDRDILSPRCGPEYEKYRNAVSLAWGAGYYLISTYGLDGLRAVIDEMESRPSFDQALQAALGVSSQELWDGFWDEVPRLNQEAVIAAQGPDPFPDIRPGTDGFSEIAHLTMIGAINGYADGLFHPDELLTRAQFAKIAALTLSIPQGTDLGTGWLDADQVPKWSLPYMAACLRDGIILGSNGRIRPNDTISRAEAAVMIIRALELTPGESRMVFADRAAIPGWAAAHVAEAAVWGIVDSGPSIRFSPNQPVTRRLAAIWLARAYWVKKWPLGVWALLGLTA